MTKYRLTHRALHAAVEILAPASRALAPTFNKLIASSGQRTQPRFILELATQEGRKAAQGWYRYQDSNTRFTSLEYRRDKEGRFGHEFIVVRLGETTICRFDRRAQYELRGLALTSEGTIAEDSAHVLSALETEYHDLGQRSEVLLRISFPDGEDLEFILAICFGIQAHPRARSYSLLEYNCYFFAWTIITAVTRRALQWEIIGASSAIQKEVIALLDNQNTFHVPRPLTKSTRKRVINWFRDLLSPLPVADVDDSEVRDVWRKSGTRMIQDSSSGLKDYLRKALLRSQLSSALAGVITQLVKSVCANEVALLVAPLVKAACDPRSRCSFPLQLPDSVKCPPPTNETLYDTPVGGTLIEHICCEATKKFLSERSKRETSGQDRYNYWNYDSRRSVNDSWDAAWGAVRQDYIGRYEPQELLSSQEKVSNAFSNTTPIGYQLLHLLAGDLKAKRIWQETWSKYYIRGEESGVFINLARRISEILVKHLADANPESLVYGEGVKRAWLARNVLRGVANLSADPPLQEFVRDRMHTHFDRVDRYGFGTFGELLTAAERAMCDIWVATLDALDGHILIPATTTPAGPTPRSEAGTMDMPGGWVP